MTRPQGQRDPQDLRRVFRDHEGSTVDVSGLMTGVRQRINRRRVRRRTAGIVAIGLVTALAAAVPIVASSIPNRDTGTAGGSSQSATASGASGAPKADGPTGEALRSTEFAFTLGERPADYTMEYASTGPGWQTLRLSVLDSVQPQRTLDVTLFDPGLSGLPAPEPTGETVAVDSTSAGLLTVQVVNASAEGQSSLGVGWLTGNGLWLTVTSDGPTDLARQEALAVAVQVDLGHPYPLTFPFQVGFVPEGFDLSGASGGGTLQGGSSFLSFHDLSPLFAGEEPALSISAINRPGVPQDAMPNTTVGPYQASLTEGLYLQVFDVGGFLINVSVRPDFGDRIDEAALRRIAQELVVIPGAASDETVWTDQPLG
ncbi:MAG: hypothetical protein H0T54_05315 [Geodermatophilaceae bacterium]|nr:hypothetical protein [Geodermatophilaceae bacterium]